MSWITDPAFWERQYTAFQNAPVACLIFLTLGAAVAWWFRKKLIAELQELRKRAQGKSVIHAKELEQGATSVLIDLARLIKRNHALEQTLDLYIPIMAGKPADKGIEFIPIMNKPPSP